MLWSLAVLIVCQAAGEMLHAVTGLPVPGTVIGLALLLLGLSVHRRNGAAASLPAADGLLPYLALFFVPPGVGAVMQVGRLVHVWPAVVLGLLGSSVLALAVAGRVAQALLERQDRLDATTPAVPLHPSPEAAP
jgi:holin-like protein